MGLSSCSLFTKEDDREKVARVGDQFLFESDIPSFTSDGSQVDSIAQRSLYIDNWVKESS